MVRIRDTGQFALGLLFVFPTVYLTALGYSISFISIYFLLAGTYSICDSILEHKTVLLCILFGFTMLISVFIWIITQNTPLLSKEVLIGIISGILLFILGIMVHLGFISE